MELQHNNIHIIGTHGQPPVPLVLPPHGVAEETAAQLSDSKKRHKAERDLS